MKSSLVILFLFVTTLALFAGCVDLSQSEDIEVVDTEDFNIKEYTFNRNPERIIFTKHGKCRMNCRSIDSLEVDEILKKGRINFKKSDTTSTKPCRKKYALEGTTRDNQLVRIIFSPCKDTQTVVTVIDMDTDWDCDCK